MCNLRTIKHQGHISGLYLEGGNPGRGFVSGLTSSLTASSVQNIGSENIAMIIGGALSGGVGAAVVGGDFYEGAVFGLIASSLNHVAHEMKDLIQVDKAIVYIKVTDEILLNDDGSIKTTKFTSLGVEYETPLYKAIISGIDINGNDVYLEVGVSRFGVKTGKINLPAKFGEHIAKYDVMKSNSNIKRLRIGETPYFIHEQWSYNDRNFGCLTMMGSSWDSFTSAISSAGHSSWGPSLNHTAIIKVTIVSAPYPIIKYP